MATLQVDETVVSLTVQEDVVQISTIENPINIKISDSGLMGYSGISGYSGYSGYSGFSGAVGSTGPQGISGYSGYSGYSGATGPQGEQGLSGYSGISGYSGQSGYSGFSGYSGISGYSGATGAQGEQGISGFSGYSGISGYSGYSGISGYSGLSGYSGATGAQGESGISGYSGYSGISGYSGFSGYSGISGFSGYSGISGFSGSQANLDNINDLSFNLSPTITPSTGQVYWDAEHFTLAVDLDSTSGVTLQVGQEQMIRAVNNTGSQINDGQVVYINSAQGNRPTVALARADALSTCQVIGVATQNIPDNNEGFVATLGEVHGYDTSIFATGDTLYLSAVTAGLLTNTAPTSPNYLVVVGKALNSTNNGKIFVHPQAPLAMDTTLAADTNVVAPSQKAVKTYVDDQNPMTTAGDIIYGGVGGAYTRLGIGGANTVLHGGTTAPVYSAVTEADISLSNVTTNNATTSRHGFLQILPDDPAKFLNGQGNFVTPTAANVNAYLEQAFSGQTSVNVIHNFTARPVVQIIDNTGAVLVPLSIVHNTVNDFTVTFDTARSGNIQATIGSPQYATITIVSDNYTITASDYVVSCTASGKTITLPTAVGRSGKMYIIDNAATAGITVATTSSQTINGNLTQSLGSNNSVSVMSNGSNWRVI